MFHSHVNPIVKIVFTPILLLFYLKYIGHPIPVLAPVFVVILLTTMPSKPPISMVIQLLLVLLLVSFAVVFSSQMLIGTPTGYALFTWGIIAWSYHRGHQNPQDIISTLTLIVIIIVTVVSKQMNYPVDGLPLVISQAFVVAFIATTAAHWVFPGEQQDVKPDEKAEGKESHAGVAMFKATAMCLVLVGLIGVGSSQTMLIAITISSMIKLPLLNHQKNYVYQRLITTATGILFTLPTMFLWGFGAPDWVVMGVSCFLGLQLASYAIRKDVHSTIYQLLFTNFTVITYQIIKNLGADSFTSGLMRLLSISVAVFVGALILRLFRNNELIIKSDN